MHELHKPVAFNAIKKIAHLVCICFPEPESFFTIHQLLITDSLIGFFGNQAVDCRLYSLTASDWTAVNDSLFQTVERGLTFECVIPSVSFPIVYYQIWVYFVGQLVTNSQFTAVFGRICIKDRLCLVINWLLTVTILTTTFCRKFSFQCRFELKLQSFVWERLSHWFLQAKHPISLFFLSFPNLVNAKSVLFGC